LKFYLPGGADVIIVALALAVHPAAPIKESEKIYDSKTSNG
jgi:hypothetical protein